MLYKFTMLDSNYEVFMDIMPNITKEDLYKMINEDGNNEIIVNFSCLFINIIVIYISRKQKMGPQLNGITLALQA